MIYRLFFRLILRRIDAEQAHDLAIAWTVRATRVPAIRRALRRLLRPREPRLRVRALGITFETPLGVAAGMDKNARWFEVLGALGFGFVEIGTVTAVAQDGAERPRIERLEQVDGMLNWMGFPNDGAEQVARRLARPRETIVGVNIGKSKVASSGKAAEDYRAATRHLAPLADYLVLNVSSPNTPGLRRLQAAEVLRELVAEVREELDELDLRVPLIVKIGPDLADDELNAVADVALEMRLDGLIAVNTTVDRQGFASRHLGPADTAGLSGAPLTSRALEVLATLRARVGNQLVLIAVGGVQTPADALDRILAGATLVQAHTGFIYGGPLWPWRVNRTLARAIRERGASSVQDLVGAAALGMTAEGDRSNGHSTEAVVATPPAARHFV
ncbi:MAG: quinone-dependent dihydroorotate dehydrogenase [Solirubrobacteraceae bacterium]